MSTFEVIRGVEGCCLALDDTRIAGPKPWGGGTVIHAWKTDKDYKAVNTHSRWFELFGTPERAARTLARMCAIGDGSCAGCPMYKANVEHCKSDYTHLKSIVEWLRGDAE
jgi:hypothetical protein